MLALEAEHSLRHAVLGTVTVAVYTWGAETATALIYGDVNGAGMVPVRLHSACLYGEALLAADCDCRSQISAAFDVFKARGRGVLVYLNQEGRGAGLVNKARAYKLAEDKGLDTFDAYVALELDPDQRDYTFAKDILLDLDVRRILLLTNNQRKVEQLRKHGIEVEQAPLRGQTTPENLAYLMAKQAKLGHDLGLR